MSYRILTALAVLCLVVMPLTAQEAEKPAPDGLTVQIAEKEPTLDDIKSKEDAEKYLEFFVSKNRPTEQTPEAIKAFLKKAGQECLTLGDKLVQIAKDDEAKLAGHMMKISGYQALIQVDKIDDSQSDKKSENEEKLEKMLDELAKDEKTASIPNSFRFQTYLRSTLGSEEEFTREKFEAFRKEIKNWSGKKLSGIEPSQVLMMIVQLAEEQAETIAKDDEKFLSGVLDDLAAFVNSSECKLDDEAKKEFTQQLDGLRRTMVGEELKLYGKTLDDKDFDWAALRGKYVLVKFTASWCGPCKMQIPGMKAAYEKYKAKGFEIVSVYISDELDNVKKAVEEEKLPWIVLSEELTEKAGRMPQGQFYNVSSVPTMLLIDKDGKVLTTEVRGPALETKLAELLDK